MLAFANVLNDANGALRLADFKECTPSHGNPGFVLRLFVNHPVLKLIFARAVRVQGFSKGRVSGFLISRMNAV